MSDTAPNAGDRGTSPVAVARKPWLSKRALTIGLVVLVCVVAVFAFWRNSNPPEEPIKEQLPQKLGAVVPYTAPMLLPTPAAVSQPPIQRTSPQPQPEPKPLVIPTQEPVARFAPSTVVQPPTPPRPYMLSYADPPAR